MSRAAQFDRADYSVRDRGAVPSDGLDRIVEALSRCEAYLLPAARAKLAAMFDRDTLLCLAFLLAVWGGLHFSPVGWLADALVQAAGLAVYLVNAAALIQAGIHAAAAETDEQLEEAAKEMAQALTDNVIDGLLAFFGNGAFQGLRRLVRGIRTRLLGRRFAGGAEKPLRLPGKLVALERGSVALGKKKKEWEKDAEDKAWLVALIGTGVFVSGGLVYLMRRRRS